MNLTLTQEGKSAYTIIYPSNGAICERKAAEELSAYLEKISGVKLHYFADESPETPYEIVLGQTNREKGGQFDREAIGMNGFTIRTEGQKLFLVGGDQWGVLYAVYELLEKFLGCRFYSSRFEKIPHKEEILLPPINETQKPGFPYRSIYWNDYIHSDDLCAKRKINYRKAGKPLPEEYGETLHYCNGYCGHTIYPLAEMEGSHIDIQPCLSSEDTYQTVLKNAREWLKKDPSAKILSISQNDTHRWSKGCECEECQKVLEETGGYIGSWIKLINRLAEELEPEYPDLLFHTFAYRFTRQFPKNIKLHKNILIELCTIESCFRHPLEECGTVGDDHIPAENFPILMDKWAELAPNLALWDYTTNFKNYGMFHPNFPVLRKNVRFFAENKVQYLFEQGNPSSLSCEFGELRGYLLTKLMWDPYMTAEEYHRITEEFIDDYFGKGAPFIKEYIRLGLEYTKDLHVTTYELQPDTFPNHKDGDQLLPHPIIPEGDRLFAAALAAEADPILKKHIDCASMQIGYLRSLYEFQVLELMYENNDPNLKAAMETYQAKNRALAEKMLHHNITYAMESVCLQDFDALHFDQPINRWSKPDHIIPV